MQFHLCKLENILRNEAYYSKSSINRVINHLQNITALLYFPLVDGITYLVQQDCLKSKFS